MDTAGSNSFLARSSGACASFGECDSPNPYYDTFYALRLIEENLASVRVKARVKGGRLSSAWDPLAAFLARAISDKLRLKMMEAARLHGAAPGPDVEYSRFLFNPLSRTGGDYVPQPDEMMSTAQMLLDSYFAPLRQPGLIAVASAAPGTLTYTLPPDLIT